MDNDELIAMHQRLQALQLEHRDLDAAINALQENHYPDQIQLSRLKKRKLQLKDAIARLESKLIPDLNA
ncbi:MAG: YdcH family protein [Pseudomonadota bacterium]